MALEIKKDGRSFYVNGILRQISKEDTIYCPVCGEEVLYWQIEQHYSTRNYNDEKEIH